MDESPFISRVFPGELASIAEARLSRPGHVARDHVDQRDPHKSARQMRLFGLALSGGGIRSATFNLGVFQALDQLGLLKYVDYLSTVSGGGYIGCWLTSWTERHKRTPDLSGADPSHEPDQISFLRRFSNYLTPRLGLLSADTLALIMTYLRNLLLNLLILATALTGVLLLLRWLASTARVLLINPAPPNVPFVVLLAALGLFQSVLIFGQLLRADTHRDKSDVAGIPPEAVQIAIVGALLAVSVMIVRLATMQIPSMDLYLWGATGAAAYSLACALGWGIQRMRGPKKPGGVAWQREKIPDALVMVVTAPLCGFLLGYLCGAFATGGVVWLLDWWGIISISPALVLTAIGIIGFIHVGLTGRGLSDHMREWWSRMGAWHVLVIVCWITAFVVALLPDLNLLPSMATYLGSAKVVSAIAWVASTLAGVLAGTSAKTGSARTSRWLDMTAKVTPSVFVLGLVILLSFAASDVGAAFRSSFSPGYGELIAGAVFLAISMFLSWRVDINEFSMLSMYRNRLTRCYLGASNDARVQTSTGLDPRDDNIPLNALSPFRTFAAGGDTSYGPYVGPYPLINTSANLVQTSNLSWQERKASSFILSPLYCGYTGADLLEAYGATPPWLNLGTAMAVSGAAVSPSMGFHTSRAAAFLMTVFNARLGRWFPNPNRQKELKNSGPTLGLFYLLYELLGLTNDRRSFVYLSDGGHFENTGLYELLRRRCRYVIVCDASADPAYTCEDISRAVARARTDFGVEIDLDLRPITEPQGSACRRTHCVTGRISYPGPGGNNDEGTILYLKASLTGDESPDIASYASRHQSFPHQSTADQFFDESQFESHRALGQHIAAGSLRNARAVTRGTEVSLEDLFTLLRQQWYPPLGAGSAVSMEHSQALARIVTEIRSTPHLQYLDYQLIPEWPELAGSRRGSRKRFWLPQDPVALRDGFYTCSRMIQLMEDVYRDLDLENQSEHPDTSGWMNLFRHWSWSSMFRVTWAITYSVHGVRFKTFCEQALGLTVGRPANGAAVRVRETAKIGRLLNFLEARIVRRLYEAGIVGDSDQVIPFRMVTTNPQNAAQSITFTYGFAIVREAGNRRMLVYLRIQDHLRRLGLARKALSYLHQEYGVEETVRYQAIANARPRRTRTKSGRVPDPLDATITREGLDVLSRLLESVKGQI